jgi:hypothetical protein
MSMLTVFRTIGGQIIGRLPVVGATKRDEHVAIAHDRCGTAPDDCATDFHASLALIVERIACLGAPTEVVTVAAVIAAAAVASASESARDQERSRKEGSWLDYGSRT